MKTIIRLSAILWALSLLPLTAGAQDIVGPGGPDSPSTVERTITVTQGQHGSITPAGTNGKVTVTSGESQVFTITALEGYVIESLTIDQKTTVAEAVGKATYSYTFPGVTDNTHSIAATFRTSRFVLTGTAAKGGSIVPARAEVDEDGHQLFTLTADPGFEIDGVQVDNGAIDPTLRGKAEGSFLLENVKASATVKATFRGKRHKVTWADPEHGTLAVTDGGGNTLASGGEVTYGDKLTVKVTPETGYIADKLTANGIRLGSASHTVTGDVTLAATLKAATYTVTVNATSAEGTLTVTYGNTTLGNGTHTLPHGSQLKLSASPTSGHKLKAYQVEPAALLATDAITLTADARIQAEWEALTYPLTVTLPTDTDGKLLIEGVPATAGEREYPYGTRLTLGNTPANGKTLDAYLVTPATALSGNVLTVTGITSVSARFKEIPKDNETTDPGTGETRSKVSFPSSLTVRLGTESLTSGGLVKKGSILSILAKGGERERLATLTANGNPVPFDILGDLATAGYEVTGPTEFKATFNPTTYIVYLDTPNGGTLTATANGTTALSGTGYPHGTVITANATPGTGYKLSRIWAGAQEITTSRKVTLTAPITLSAEFTPETAINPAPDPSDPDPDSPLGIDLTPQTVTYDRSEKVFLVRTLPEGVIDKIAVTYRQNGKTVKPLNAGKYDLSITRAADDRFAVLDETVPAGLVILPAPVTLTDVTYSEQQTVGGKPSTTATLEGGKAEYLGKAVEGTFAWKSDKAVGNRLTLESSAYEEVVFTPKDANNFLGNSSKVRIQVGAAQPATYTVNVKTVGKGTVELYTGSLRYPMASPFYDGMELSIHATPGEGYRLSGFEIAGVSYNRSPYTVTVTGDLEVTARFIEKENPANPTDPTSPTALKVEIDIPSSCVYDGEAKRVTVSSTPAIGGFRIKYLNKDGQAVIPVEAGNYQAVVSRDEDDIYQAYSKAVTLTVGKAIPAIATSPTATPIPAGASLEDSRLSGGEVRAAGLGMVPGTFSWINPETRPTTTADHPFQFTPSDKTNFYGLSENAMNAEVRVISGNSGGQEPTPILITYARPSGGTLTVTLEDDTPLPSGSLIEAGTTIQVKVKENSGMKLEHLTLGGTDYTAKAISGQGTVMKEMFVSSAIEAIFASKSGTTDPENPDPGPGPGPDPDPGIDPDPNPGTDPDPEPGYGNYTVWVSKIGLGTVSPETSKVKWGDQITFTVTPGIGQQLVDVRLNGNSVGAVNSYTLSNIQADASVEVIFSQPGIPVHTLTSKVEGKGGSVTPTVVRVTEGSNHRFILLKEGKAEVADVKVGDDKGLKSVGKHTSYLFRDVKADSLIVATFAIPTAIEEVTSAQVAKITSGNGYIQVAPLRGPVVLSLYGVNGQLAFRQRISTGTTVTSLTTSIYLIELRGKGYIAKEKVFVKNW